MNISALQAIAGFCTKVFAFLVNTSSQLLKEHDVQVVFTLTQLASTWQGHLGVAKARSQSAKN